MKVLNQPRLLLAAVVALAVVAVIAAWAALPSGDDAPLPAAAVGRLTGEQVDEATAGRDLGPLTRPEAQTAVAAAVAGQRELRRLPRAEREAIAQAAVELVELYRAGSFDDFAAWQESKGLPPGRWMADGEGERDWLRSQKITAGASYDLADVRALLLADGGRARAEIDSGGRAQTYKRNPATTGGAGDVDPEGYRGKLVAVVIPMRLVDKQGDPFLADVAVELARRDGDGEWVPVGVTVAGIPNGIGLPPLPI